MRKLSIGVIGLITVLVLSVAARAEEIWRTLPQPPPSALLK